MGFNQMEVGVFVLLLSVGLSTAQWPLKEAVLAPLGFQHNNSGYHSVPVNTGLTSQWLQRDPQAGSPVVAPLGVQLQNPSGPQNQQVVQQPAKKVTWRFPAAPQIPTPPAPVHFVRQSDPVPAQGVTVKCNETAVRVEVRRDLFGTDAPLNIAAFTLGGCAARGMDASSQVFIFESALYGCNSKLTVTAKELVYIFSLGMASVPLSSTPIQRVAATVVSIECHYLRFHNVSSNPLMPVWIPYASAQAAEELLVFSLRLMMADWTSERPSNQYYLGELINIEASVLQFNHIPLRVLVDSCVATPVPDINAIPRYSFIENYGCMIDAKLTHSSSHFLPQTQASKLRLQLEAFRFQQVNSSMVYIACLLKATAASAPADAEHKACSFLNNGWAAAYGADLVCSCCSSSCAGRKGHDLASEQGLQLVKEVSLRPVVVLENAL
ncbi:zona pellucida sperm-binding protein 3-like [Tachysurus fulvidraco]|uniref:zona pellucida sperm-binding protein 3-like n=1 Tax=Tachysurus fulvidraco TaxID=1234273 RepID=UPI001FEE61CD|nr:zona pellucida sperm-binding protein 3-like [Tachysurus fulvidraco]